MNDVAPDATLDPETRAAHDDHDALRLWLRMLTCTMLVERHIKARLKRRFGMSLPRFDLMAQLERASDGIRMSELSRRLMVSGGNVTSLVDQLVEEGLVERRDVPGDRRAFAVALTPGGRAPSSPWRASTRPGSSSSPTRCPPRTATASTSCSAASSARCPPSERETAMTMDTHRRPFRDYAARHFRYAASEDGKVATVTLDRPERKNPLTFDAYAELRDLFRDLVYASDVKAVVITGAGGNFSSGGDVHEIIGPLTRMDMPGLLAFTRMTGDLVKAMRALPAADRRRGGRRVRRRGRDGGARGRPARRHAEREDRVPVRARGARGLRTWAPARCCRARSARGAPRSCSTPGAR